MSTTKPPTKTSNTQQGYIRTFLEQAKTIWAVYLILSTLLILLFSATMRVHEIKTTMESNTQKVDRLYERLDVIQEAIQKMETNSAVIAEKMSNVEKILDNMNDK